MLLTRRSFVLLCALLGALVFGWVKWRDASSLLGQSTTGQSTETAGPVVTKQPVTFTNREFDPARPPAEMPPLTPGDEAECDSDFLSSASVAGETRQTDSTHATVTITQVRVALQLNITIWVPIGATERVVEHEAGHRQISEHYYQTADKVAERIAATYIGRQVDITGADLDAESSKLLQQLAAEITEKYNRELNPGPTQLLFDAITAHGRNGVVVKDAVAAAIKNVTMATLQPWR